MGYHRYWELKLQYHTDMAHCMCCPCGEGPFPIGATRLENVRKDRKPIGRTCIYGQTCVEYSDTRIFLKELGDTFVAKTKEDYNRWVAHRASTG